VDGTVARWEDSKGEGKSLSQWEDNLSREEHAVEKKKRGKEN